jgi:hypothetical protein
MRLEVVRTSNVECQTTFEDGALRSAILARTSISCGLPLSNKASKISKVRQVKSRILGHIPQAGEHPTPWQVCRAGRALRPSGNGVVTGPLLPCDADIG